MKKKTLAFVHPVFPSGGTEKVTLEVGEYLCRQGFRVIVLCREFRSDLMPRNSHIEVLNYCNKLRKREAAEEIIQHVRQQDIQVVTYGLFLPPFASYIKEQTGCKIVVTAHSMPFWQSHAKNAVKERRKDGNLWERITWNLWYRPLINVFHRYDKKGNRDYLYTLTEIDAYVVLCPEYREQLCQVLHLDENIKKRIHVIPNFQQPNEQPNLEKDKLVIYVGRLSYVDKRVDRLLRIWAMVESQVSDWRLEIVGEGDEEQNLRALAQRLGLRNVSFEGRQNPQPYYERAAILCLTSALEGWGLVLTEAQANGVVPIAFDCSAGVHNLLSPSGEYGILLTPSDLDAYTRELLRLMSDDARRAELRQRVLQRKYPKEDVCCKYHQLYQQLCEDASS